jgi:hypothetical protein
METQTATNAEQVSDSLFNDATDVRLEDGTIVTVNKVRMKHNEFVLGLLTKVIGILGTDSQGNLSIPIGDPVKMLQLISNFPNDINQLIATMTDLSVERVGELDTAEGLALIMKIGEVNRAFFTARVAPLLTGMLARAEVPQSEAATVAAEISKVRRTRRS